MNIDHSYHNAYRLLLGETTYDKLAEQEEFYLPKNHEDPNMLLKHFEDTEEYEKCAKIIKVFAK